MALPTDYGVELTLLLQFNGDWEGVYTYYNHGQEPPLGGVRGDASEAVIIPLQECNKLIAYTDLWIDHVRRVTENPKDHNPDLPLELNLKVQDNGNLRLKIKMETLDMKIVWNKETNNIEFDAREAFDLSWEGFLYYKTIFKDFCNKAKEQNV